MPMMADPQMPLTIPTVMAPSDVLQTLQDWVKVGCVANGADILGRISYDDDPAETP